MTVYFGLNFDDRVYPESSIQVPKGGIQYFGPQSFLYFLEAHLGLIGHSPDNEYLRVEQYRQFLRTYLHEHPATFFAKAFEADQFATAIDLLQRRDELLLAGWDFSFSNTLPSRLQVLAAVEVSIRSSEAGQIAMGWADRMHAVLEVLPDRELPLQRLIHREPVELLPPVWQRLITILKRKGVQIEAIDISHNVETTDLGRLKEALTSPPSDTHQKQALQGDGSLLLLCAKRETDLATFLAQLFQQNPSFRPVCLIPDKSQTLDNALVQEGLPSLGIAPTSLARPSLQVLKLVTTFLWKPLDPYKVMEFVSLSIKPLEDELSYRIATQIAQTPGLKGEGWRKMIGRYFGELRERAAIKKGIAVTAIQEQYSFWFDRNRYDIQQKAPKTEVLGIFQRLRSWAFELYEEQNSENASLLVLSEQARKICELLQALPEAELTHLELERIVRTIYEAAPAQVTPPQKGHLPYVHHSTAFVQTIPDLLWWNFSQAEPDHFFSRWYGVERTYLAQQGCELSTPVSENALLIWQRKQAILSTTNRLVLVIPEQVNGQTVFAHPLLSDLEANFEGLEQCEWHLDKPSTRAAWQQHFQLPTKKALTSYQLGKPKSFITLDDSQRLGERTAETFSSLSSMFYYPYKWVFKHKIRLQKSPILSVVPDQTLMGNLSHRFFEGLLQEDIYTMSKEEVAQWIDSVQRQLLEREGAVLLMYGREPERVGFIQRLKFSAWSLVELIQQNGWTVEGVEVPLEATHWGITIKARADLLLKRGEERAVIDLKWRGARFREQMIRNEEDLQLVLYAKLLAGTSDWAHTAYFIMESGKMIARNELAFRGIRSVSKEVDHQEVNQRIWDRMGATFQWRMQQVREGAIEIRCTQTQQELDELYGADLLDVLEMKSEDAPFDDYRTLINLIN